MQKYFKNGFTLAEVLITIVIIGVIATLTIPVAITKMQDQNLKSQFAKAYSTMSQALNQTVMYDFFGFVNCSYFIKSDGNIDFNLSSNAECTSFYNAFTKNLHIQKICRGNAKSGGCIPTYQSYFSGASGCTYFNQTNIDNSNHAFVLANGQILITYGPSNMPLFLVDINGHKGPNAYGKDLFNMDIGRSTENGGFYLHYGNPSCEFPVSGGRTTKEMIQYSLGGKK